MSRIPTHVVAMTCMAQHPAKMRSIKHLNHRKALEQLPEVKLRLNPQPYAKRLVPISRYIHQLPLATAQLPESSFCCPTYILSPSTLEQTPRQTYIERNHPSPAATNPKGQTIHSILHIQIKTNHAPTPPYSTPPSNNVILPLPIPQFHQCHPPSPPQSRTRNSVSPPRNCTSCANTNRSPSHPAAATAPGLTIRTARRPRADEGTPAVLPVRAGLRARRARRVVVEGIGCCLMRGAWRCWGVILRG